jgi:hypothetical protein
MAARFRYVRGRMRFANRATPSAATVAPPRTSPTTFVVVHVRHTLQQVGAIGAYSAARVVTGAIRTESLRITLPV